MHNGLQNNPPSSQMYGLAIMILLLVLWKYRQKQIKKSPITRCPQTSHWRPQVIQLQLCHFYASFSLSLLIIYYLNTKVKIKGKVYPLILSVVGEWGVRDYFISGPALCKDSGHHRNQEEGVGSLLSSTNP